MTSRPILFSAPMVRAILEGRKTQTRRIVKPQPTFADPEHNYFIAERPGRPFLELNCPYGQPGDQLWVRETFAEVEMDNGSPFAFRADGDRIGCHPWQPSIFMPQRASRITLEIVSIHVERLQDISEADAKAEGLETGDYWANQSTLKTGYKVKNGLTNEPVYAYEELWESINGPGSWDANPWVWVVEFKRIEQPNGQVQGGGS